MKHASIGPIAVHFPERIEVGANPTLMAMVAGRIGWAITTPLGYMRAVRFHDAIDVHPLPITPFARHISLFASSDWIDTVPRDVAATVQRLIQTHFVSPALDRLPWLSEAFVVADPV